MMALVLSNPISNPLAQTVTSYRQTPSPGHHCILPARQPLCATAFALLPISQRRTEWVCWHTQYLVPLSSSKKLQRQLAISVMVKWLRTPHHSSQHPAWSTTTPTPALFTLLTKVPSPPSTPNTQLLCHLQAFQAHSCPRAFAQAILASARRVQDLRPLLYQGVLLSVTSRAGESWQQRFPLTNIKAGSAGVNACLVVTVM